MVYGVGDPKPIAAALLAEDASLVADPDARAFRIFADQTKSDRRALAACIMAPRDRIPGDEIAAFQSPVLVAVGTEDSLAGPAKPLADAIPGAEAFDSPAATT